jgi:hypothetical protein
MSKDIPVAISPINNDQFEDVDDDPNIPLLALEESSELQPS